MGSIKERENKLAVKNRAAKDNHNLWRRCLTTGEKEERVGKAKTPRQGREERDNRALGKRKARSTNTPGNPNPATVRK